LQTTMRNFSFDIVKAKSSGRMINHTCDVAQTKISTIGDNHDNEIVGKEWFLTLALPMEDWWSMYIPIV